jgi:hypothetical protein
MKISQLKTLWEQSKEDYKTQEVGTGVQSFVRKFFESEELFNLKEGKLGINEFIQEKSTKAGRQADFVIYIDTEIKIPVEVECFTHIERGLWQLRNYQKDLEKEYGILTDGYTWRFYKSNSYKDFTLDDIFRDTENFLEFWKEYIKSDFYYLSFFEPRGQQKLFKKAEMLLVEYERENFFEDITKLIKTFKNKLKIEGYFENGEKKDKERKAKEIAYAYIIQFILYKVLVDNDFGDYPQKFVDNTKRIHEFLKVARYKDILSVIEGMPAEISENIYRPFNEEQKLIVNRLLGLYRKRKNEVSDVSPWLDIFVFIKKYNFANIHTEIFGYIYENYLKDLYGEEKKGQHFTDPAIVKFMLQQIEYVSGNIEKCDKDSISIIDPACGSGTFLYKAVDSIIESVVISVGEDIQRTSKEIMELVNNNVFGLDIADFPLYLAEMSILKRMLPYIISEKYNNPVDKKIKLFLTKDSIAEFLDPFQGRSKGQAQTKLFYPIFHRDIPNLNELKESLITLPRCPRRRFDFVVGNPPYISYLECAKQKQLIFELIKQRKVKLNNIYGVNLHSIPDNPKKYAPTPNLFAFFIALGLALLKDKGKLCYIVPQTVLVDTALDVIRYHLAKFTTIEKLIIFSRKMFIGRGLKQNKAVSTSSLIFVVTQQAPLKAHKIEVINYKNNNDNLEEVLQDILEGKNINKVEISQEKLLQNVVNWIFIKRNKIFLDFYEEYKKNTDNMSLYYNHIQAEQQFKSKFYFDRGLKYPKNKIEKGLEVDDDMYYISALSKLSRNKNKITSENRIIESKYLDIPHGSQGEIVFKQKYKIIWNYMNFDRFRYSDQRIMLPFNWVLISSNNKNEILYLFSLLDAKVQLLLINNLFRIENEDKLSILLGIKLIKGQIRIPKIAKDNQFIKDEIIKRTEEMLALEGMMLSNLVDFSDIIMQKFDNATVENKNLVLINNNEEIKCKINGDINLVKRIINKKYDVKKQKVGLSELKSLSVVDFEKQDAIKDYIDDLIFALYFNVHLQGISLEKANIIKEACEENEFYKVLLSTTSAFRSS